MKARYLVATAVALTISASTWADEGALLYKKRACSVCHAIDKKMIGPTYREVAAKYAGDSTAQAWLELKVRNGGSGVWGRIHMPGADKNLSDETIKTLVTWILSQK